MEHAARIAWMAHITEQIQNLVTIGLPAMVDPCYVASHAYYEEQTKRFQLELEAIGEEMDFQDELTAAFEVQDCKNLG